MALLLFPSIADNRKTSLIRLISDLGLGIAVPRLKKRATIRAITSMSAAASPHPGGGEIIGLRWRFRRPQVALSIGPGTRVHNNSLAADAGTFELLRCGPDGDVTIIPRNTLPDRDEFLQARYPQLQTIRLEGFHLPIPAQPEDVECLLEDFPKGFIREPEYGLGLLKELNLIVSAIEKIDDVRHLVVSMNRASEIDRDCYILEYSEFDAVRRALGRIHDAALRSAGVDKRILVHNELLTTRLPKQFSERHRPYKRDTIFKAVSGKNEAGTLSPADRGAALAIVSKSKRELARTDGPALLKFHRDIELVTLEQLIERIEAFMGTKKPEQVWQQLFLDNPFILTLAFGLPIVALRGQVSVGGRTFAGAGDKIADFLYRNGLTDNVTLLEIKTPETKVLGSVYRGGVQRRLVIWSGL
jgi:hypothetical protein